MQSLTDETKISRLAGSGLPAVLGLLWLAVQLALYYHFGPRTSVDSPLYLTGARQLLLGRLPTNYGIWYVSYSAFLAVVLALGGGVKQMIICQILLSGAAAAALWGAVRRLSGSVGPAHLATGLYLLWFKIHHWNVFIYTESLFTSCCVLAFALLGPGRPRWQHLLLLALAGYTFLLRPTGYCFLIGLASYGWARLPARRPAPRRLIGLAVLAGLLLLLNKMLASYSLVESYARAEIIYPGLTLGLTPPAGLTVLPAHFPPLVRLAAFVATSPLFFLKLASLKLLLFLSNVKPYFSAPHNALVALVLWPLYALAVRGYRRLPPRNPEKYFIAGFVGALALTVALTTENWDGRFLVPALPFVFVLSAVGLRWWRAAPGAPPRGTGTAPAPSPAP